MNIFVVLLIMITSISGFGQNCEANFKHGTVSYIPKGQTQNEEQMAIALNSIKELTMCFQWNVDFKEKYWFGNTLANKYAQLSEIDSSIKYTKLAYSLDSESFCSEYISLYVSSLDVDFPFKLHYLDTEAFDELHELNSDCKNRFLANALLDKQKKRLAQEEELKMDSHLKTYFEALNEIGERDQEERKKSNLNWNVQRTLDALNRLALDSLFEKYGFPFKDVVTSQGLSTAFMVLHHSTDCKWNEHWTRRFLKNIDAEDLGPIFSFYFYRNFNEEDGSCTWNTNFIKELKEGEFADKTKPLFDFSQWEDR